MKDQNASFPQDLPWGSEDPEIRNDACSDEYYGEDVHGAPWEPTLTIDEVSHLLDQMVMDIQHLELEVIRARYRLSFFLNPPYDKYAFCGAQRPLMRLTSAAMRNITAA